MTDENEKDLCLGKPDTEALKSKASLVEKAKTIGFKPAEIAELKRLYPELKITAINLFVLIVPALLVTGCVTTALDVDTKAIQPIPAKLVSQMRAKSMSPSDPILVRIFKQESELEIWKSDKSGKMALLKTYPMCRWSGKLGPKKKNGDRQAPEGIYHVSAGMLNPRSQYHLSFNLGYPNKLEAALGYTGDALMVHGACSSSGCFALTDDGVSEIYAVARDALKGKQSAFQVQSFPFRMTPENMAKNRDNANLPFWENLKIAYDFFEIRKQQPRVSYCGRKYAFESSLPAFADPMAACPLKTIADPLVLAKTKADQETIASLLQTGTVSAAYSYSDGGMHPAFRQQLRRTDAKTMANRTSFTSVPISRPKAALSDPHLPSAK